MRRTAIQSTAKQVSQAVQNFVLDGINFSAFCHLQLVWMTCTCIANKHFGTKAHIFVPEQTGVHILAVSTSATAKSVAFRIPAYFTYAFASIYVIPLIDTICFITLYCAAYSAHEAVLTLWSKLYAADAASDANHDSTMF